MANTVDLDMLAVQNADVARKLVNLFTSSIRDRLRTMKKEGRVTRADFESIANAANTCAGMLPA